MYLQLHYIALYFIWTIFYSNFMTTIQVRIDEKTKNSAKKILDDVGMDMSSAIKVYLKQIVIYQGLPFKLLTKNGLTVQEENQILKATEEAEKGINVTVTKNWKETKNFLDSLKKKQHGNQVPQKIHSKLPKTVTKNTNKSR